MVDNQDNRKNSTAPLKRLSQKSKKVLLLVYYFPPLGMGGTQRAAKFVKYLREFGWRPFVVTVKDVAYYTKDASLLQEVQTAKIARTGSFDPQRLMALFASKKSASLPNARPHKLTQTVNSFLSWILIPDTKILWLPFAFFKAIKIIRKEKIDCLLTTSPPHSVHLLGKFLKRVTGIPWVVDFRDGWSEGNFQKEPTPVHKRLNRALEKSVLRNADHVVGVSSKLVSRLVEQFEDYSAKFHTITNGFDSDDFPKKKLGSNKKFTITYSGTLTAISPVDSFLKALSGLVSRRPEMRSDILVNFVGTDLVGVKNVVENMNLSDVVEFRGYLTHREAIENILKSDLLLYTIAEWASEDFIPGKTFEYLASRIPVLAIGPRVEGVQILEKYASVLYFTHEKVEEIIQALLRSYTDFKEGRPGPKNQKDFSRFDRRALTKSLAEILDKSIPK